MAPQVQFEEQKHDSMWLDRCELAHQKAAQAGDLVAGALLET